MRYRHATTITACFVAALCVGIDLTHAVRAEPNPQSPAAADAVVLRRIPISPDRPVWLAISAPKDVRFRITATAAETGEARANKELPEDALRITEPPHTPPWRSRMLKVETGPEWPGAKVVDLRVAGIDAKGKPWRVEKLATKIGNLSDKELADLDALANGRAIRGGSAPADGPGRRHSGLALQPATGSDVRPSPGRDDALGAMDDFVVVKPNPYRLGKNKVCTIQIRVPHEACVLIGVSPDSGKPVYTAGWIHVDLDQAQQTTWDGVAEGNKRVSPGTYWCEVLMLWGSPGDCFDLGNNIEAIKMEAITVLHRITVKK